MLLEKNGLFIVMIDVKFSQFSKCEVMFSSPFLFYADNNTVM